MHLIMDIARRSAAVMAGVWLVAGCAADHRDSGGNPMILSEAVETLPTESRFNTYALLTSAPDAPLMRMIRDNGNHYIEEIDAERFELSIEHATQAWYSRTMRAEYDDPETLVADLDPSKISNLRKIEGSVPNSRGAAFDYGRCTIAAFVTRLKSQTLYDNDHYQADTVVRIMDCRSALPRMSGRAVDRFIRELDFMTDRDREHIAVMHRDLLSRAKPETNTTNGS